jgi:hypothetical protein
LAIFAQTLKKVKIATSAGFKKRALWQRKQLLDASLSDNGGLNLFGAIGKNPYYEAQEALFMKHRRLPVTVFLSRKPCQRPGCESLGRPRLQTRGHHPPRFIYLCDWCPEFIAPTYLSDLFVRFGVGVNKAS